MKLTSYEDSSALLGALLERIQSVLGTNIIGVYIYGSLVSGGFDPDVSDIDLLAVTARTISKPEFEALKKMHADNAWRYSRWNNRIEVQYTALSALQTFKIHSSKIVTISPGEPMHFVNAGIDWLLNWYEVQENGVVLFGPNQSSILPSISKSEYVSALKDSARYWHRRIHTFTRKSSRGWGAYIVLTMCRMLYGYRYGKQASKPQAAVWATKEYPQWATLIAAAITWRKAQWKKKQKSIGAALSDIHNFVYFAIEQVVKE